MYGTGYRTASARRRIAASVTTVLAGLGGTTRTGVAHTFGFTQVTALLKEDGTYQIDMTIDVDALALGVPPTTDSAWVAAELKALPPDQLERAVNLAGDTVLRRVRVRFDGKKQTPKVTFPDEESDHAVPSQIPTVLGTTARLTGRVPAGAGEFTFGASRAFPPVHLTVLEEATLGRFNVVLAVSEDSPAYPLGGATAAPQISAAWRYLLLGFTHIVPQGMDHILFVVGLFLLSPRLKPLLVQVTAFTIAHSATLALSIYGLVGLPSRLVESLIALSITCVAIENIMTTKLRPWRPAVVFAFGLLHGMGFAGVLRDLGLPRDQFVTALVAFNIGVELGQLSVVACAFGTVGWLRRRAWYRAAVAIPVSAFIGLIGLIWFVLRATG